MPIDDQEVYFGYPNLFEAVMDCTGCVPTDTINTKDSTGNSTTPVVLGNATIWQQRFSPLGNSTGMVQRLIEISLIGTDGAVSNTFDVAYAGSQNGVVVDSSGNYYYCCGVAVSTSATAPYSLKFPAGSMTPSKINVFGPAIAIDASTQTLYFTEITSLTPNSNGIEPVALSTGTAGALIPITNGQPLAIDAADGLVCVTIPTGTPTPNATDAVDCHNSSGTLIAPGIPSGSEPAAVKVIDGSHFVVYGRGDQTLRWYTVAGATAIPAGSLPLGQFTAITPAYWSNHPITGGWNIALEGQTLAVMGQVVGSPVTQELALVNNSSQTLVGYANLPVGTLRIAADPTNSAFVAAYPDFTGKSPVTRFVRVSASSGSVTALTSTSPVVPAAGLAVTPDGSKIGVFAAGQADFEANN